MEEQQHETDLIKRLEQLGIKVDVTSVSITLTYEQIYTSGSTLEEAVATFVGEALSRYEALRNRIKPGLSSSRRGLAESEHKSLSTGIEELDPE